MRPLGALTELPALAADVRALIHLAGSPFLDWFYGGASEARAAVTRQLEDPAAEMAASRTTVLLDGERRLLGLYVAMGGAELASCRQSETLTLLRTVPARSRAGFLARMRDVRALFAPVSPRDFYLSKLAVMEGVRRSGHGRVLLEAYLAAGRDAGFARFRLDVSADNEAARALYRSAGFEVMSDGQAGAVRYLAMGLRVAPTG
jgi:ribosomal protein S18 acetylase RimI-like enzyme